MTDHGQPQAEDEVLVRTALQDAVADLPFATGLTEGMFARAARIRRRRAAAGGAAATALVVLGVLLAPSLVGRPAVQDPSVAPARTGAPDGVRRELATAAPAPSPAPPTRRSPTRSGGTATNGTTTNGTSSAGTAPAVRWGPAVLQDDFDAPGPDAARWVSYTGTAQPVGRWSPDALSVAGGRLRIDVSAPVTDAAATLNGGLKSVVAQRTGRWAVRWRMTPGPAVLAQVVLLGDGPGGVRYAATLDPTAGTVTVQDLVGGGEKQVPVDAGTFHTVALERTADGARWLLDGRTVLVTRDTGPGRPLVLGVQAFVADPGCVGPSGRACPGPRTATVEVDSVTVRPPAR